jgi:endonuclease/exonuclease/phosphatase family metal-dependent hydrolase
MKLVSLNTWGGRRWQDLQEYNHFYHPHLEDYWGLAMFVRKDIDVIDFGEVFVHKKRGYNLELEKQGQTAKNIQYVHVELDNKPLTIINFHGLWNGLGKGDSGDRLSQSRNIISFFKTLKEEGGEIVFVGDFNLDPETESLKMFEKFGLRNLVKEYRVTSTKTSFYTKPGKFADYIFVSSGIKVNDFKVLLDEVSDHSPLYLDFDVI